MPNRTVAVITGRAFHRLVPTPRPSSPAQPPPRTRPRPCSPASRRPALGPHDTHLCRESLCTWCQPSRPSWISCYSVQYTGQVKITVYTGTLQCTQVGTSAPAALPIQSGKQRVSRIIRRNGPFTGPAMSSLAVRVRELETNTEPIMIMTCIRTAGLQDPRSRSWPPNAFLGRPLCGLDARRVWSQLPIGDTGVAACRPVGSGLAASENPPTFWP